MHSLSVELRMKGVVRAEINPSTNAWGRQIIDPRTRRKLKDEEQVPRQQSQPNKVDDCQTSGLWCCGGLSKGT
jgi:hypothetical protein